MCTPLTNSAVQNSSFIRRWPLVSSIVGGERQREVQQLAAFAMSCYRHGWGVFIQGGVVR